MVLEKKRKQTGCALCLLHLRELLFEKRHGLFTIVQSMLESVKHIYKKMLLILTCSQMFFFVVVCILLNQIPAPQMNPDDFFKLFSSESALPTSDVQLH